MAQTQTTLQEAVESPTPQIQQDADRIKQELIEEASSHCKKFSKSKARERVRRLAQEGYHFHEVLEHRRSLRPYSMLAGDSLMDAYPGWYGVEHDTYVNGWRLWSWQPTGSPADADHEGRMAYIKPTATTTDVDLGRLHRDGDTHSLDHSDIKRGIVVEVVMPERRGEWELRTYEYDNTNGTFEDAETSEPKTIADGITELQDTAYRALVHEVRSREFGFATGE